MEPVERPVEDVENGHVVTDGSEGRRALRPDQPCADHDDTAGAAGECHCDPLERCRVGVDERRFGTGDRWRRIAEAGSEHDGLRLDLDRPRDSLRTQPATRQIGLGHHAVEQVDAPLGQPFFVREQAKAAVGERSLRQRRAIDRRAGPDEERPDPMPREPGRARVPRHAIPDDRDLRRHPSSTSTRPSTTRVGKRPHGLLRRSLERRTGGEVEE